MPGSGAEEPSEEEKGALEGVEIAIRGRRFILPVEVLTYAERLHHTMAEALPEVFDFPEFTERFWDALPTLRGAAVAAPSVVSLQQLD